MTAQLTGYEAHQDHDSPNVGATEQPHLARRQNWVNQLERHALMQPGAAALRFLGHTVTWSELRRRVAALAGALSRRGVGSGDRVMILMLNRTEFVESVLAANMIGAIAVPINFRLTPTEIAFLVDDCEARVMITEPVLAAVGNGVRDITSVLNTVVVAGDAADEGLVSYEELVNELADLDAIKVATWWNTAAPVWRASDLERLLAGGGRKDAAAQSGESITVVAEVRL